MPKLWTFSTAAIASVMIAAPPASATFGTSYAALPPNSDPGWTMPWQLSPASPASRAQGEQTFLTYLPGYGAVRGTSLALHYLLTPLFAQAGRNSLVDSCRATVAQSAAKLGSVRVEAASAGPERRTRGGVTAPVTFRLTYARFNGRENYEVRQSVLTCKADRFGNIVDAVV